MLYYLQFSYRVQNGSWNSIGYLQFPNWNGFLFILNLETTPDSHPTHHTLCTVPPLGKGDRMKLWERRLTCLSNSTFKDLFLFYTCGYFVCMHVHAPCVCSGCEFWKRMLDPLKLELQIVVNYHVGCWRANPGHL